MVEVCDVKLGYSVGPVFSGEIHMSICLHFSQGVAPSDFLYGLCDEI